MMASMSSAASGRGPSPGVGLESNGRNRWKTTREKNRIKSRFNIRQRILGGALDSEDDAVSRPDPQVEASPAGGSQLADLDQKSGPQDHLPPDSSSTTALSGGLSSPHSSALIRQVLRRIIINDRSYFSVQFLDQQAIFLSTPFPTPWLRVEPEEKAAAVTDTSPPAVEPAQSTPPPLVGEQQLLSRFGPQMIHFLHQDVCDRWETCTVLEYAVWLERYAILGLLLMGGVDPCQRGTLYRAEMEHAVGDDTRIGDEEERQGDPYQATRRGPLPGDAGRTEMGSRVLQHFFQSTPLTLSRFLVKRAVDMRVRLATTRYSHGGSPSPKMGSPVVKVCGVCLETMAVAQVGLSFGEPCDHFFCEACYWTDILQHLNSRLEGCVVICPVCSKESTAASGMTTTTGDDMDDSETDADSRRQISLTKFMELPVDSNQLKARPGKPKKVHDKDLICSSWSQAVAPFLGQSQQVRVDKFFHYVEKGSFPFVRGCLEMGVDVHVRNVYGQSALYIAAWYGYDALVKILLHYGADPNIDAHGRQNVMSVATAHHRTEIMRLLHGRCHPNGGDSWWHPIPQTMSDFCPTLEFLIDPSLDHVGAGSFVVDQALAPLCIQRLVDLWKELPVEQTAKQKQVPCSVRSYFCDAEGVVTRLLEEAVSMCLPEERVTFLPHMRFLCYEEPGAILAPHVDLCRVDTVSGERSTHSFLLYLTPCARGGATTLLQDLAGDGRNKVLARVEPRAGRLLLFPHACPHEGELVEDTPKLLIRGEANISFCGAESRATPTFPSCVPARRRTCRRYTQAFD